MTIYVCIYIYIIAHVILTRDNAALTHMKTLYQLQNNYFRIITWLCLTTPTIPCIRTEIWVRRISASSRQHNKIRDPKKIHNHDHHHSVTVFMSSSRG
jgi:hypothetical protein